MRMNKELAGALAWGVGILIAALLARWAREQGRLDGETVTRLVIGLNGLMIAWFGNRLPKAFVPVEWARQVRRVGGWSLVLSGLVYAGLWAFAPLPLARIGGATVVAIGIAVTVVHCWRLRASIRASLRAGAAERPA